MHMRINMPVTQQENDSLREDELVCSKTNPKGIITYANAALCRISGFAEKELLGTPHNIMRHPDMPPEAFRDMWDTLKLGQPWQGMIKNRRKDGDHYWANATVTPRAAIRSASSAGVALSTSSVQAPARSGPASCRRADPRA